METPEQTPNHVDANHVDAKEILLKFINHFKQLNEEKRTIYLNYLKNIFENIINKYNLHESYVNSVKEIILNEEFEKSVENFEKFENPETNVENPETNVEKFENPEKSEKSPFEALEGDFMLKYNGGAIDNIHNDIVKKCEELNDYIRETVTELDKELDKNLKEGYSNNFPQTVASMFGVGILCLTVGQITVLTPWSIVTCYAHVTLVGIKYVATGAIMAVPAIAVLINNTTNKIFKNTKKPSTLLNNTENSAIRIKKGGNSHRKKKQKTMKQRKLSRKRRRTKK